MAEDEEEGQRMVRAVRNKQKEKAMRIISNRSGNSRSLDTQDWRGNTALIYAAGHSDLPDVASFLIEKGADVHIRDKWGHTALHQAAGCGRCVIIPQLLGAGAVIDEMNNNGSTPLMVAACNGEDDAVTLLLEEGADASLKNKIGETAFDMANTSIQNIFRSFMAKKPAVLPKANQEAQPLRNNKRDEAENKKNVGEELVEQKDAAKQEGSDKCSLHAWLKTEVLHDKLDQVEYVCDRFKQEADCDSLEDLLSCFDDFNKKFLREEMKLSIVLTKRILDGMEEAKKRKDEPVTTNVDHKHSLPLPPPPHSPSTNIPKDSSSTEEGGGGMKTAARRLSPSDVLMLQWLGAGGFGKVNLALFDHQHVAVKSFGEAAMTPRNMESIYNEVNIMMQLKHPCLVELLGLVHDDRAGSDDPPKLVMEYAPNGSLYSFLRSKREISWADRHRIAGELARGLAYLHKKKVVHRDIKSLNVVLGEGMVAKWCDFGLSCLKKHSVESKTATVKGEDGPKEDSEVSVMGTFRWMSPELLNRLSGRCFESDIWAFGMLLFELASRDIPFSDEPNEMAVRGWIMDGRGENVPEGCSSVLGDLMQNCWKDRALRPTAEQIELTLMAVVAPLSSSSSFSLPSSASSSSMSHSGLMMKDSAMGSLSASFSSVMGGNKKE